MNIKIFRNAAAFAIGLLMASCGQDGQTLTAEGVEGKSADVISISDESSKLALSGDKDLGQTLIIKVKLKLEKSLPGIKDLDPDDIKLGLGPSLSIMDENGAELTKLEMGNGSSDIDNTTDLKKLLQSDEGTEKEISFADKVLSGDIAKKIVEKAKTFKIKDLDIDIPGFTNLSGNIGTYPAQMTLLINTDGSITGAYFYKKSGPKALLYLKGMKNGNNISLDEFTKEGKQTGSYQGTLVNGVFSGLFSTNDKTFNFTLRPDNNMEAINFSNINFDSFTSESAGFDDTETASTDADIDSFDPESGNVDYDEVLDAFEEYVNQYERVMRKAMNGDVSVISESSDLNGKLQDLIKKLNNAEGNMSATQWARYMKICKKWQKDIQEMQRIR